MSWFNKSKEEALFQAALEESELFSSLATLQGGYVKIIEAVRAEKLDYAEREFRKAVVYVFYDTLATVRSWRLAGQPNDVIAAFFRDRALKYFEIMVEPQLRTYAADATSYSELAAKSFHPPPLVEMVKEKPEFFDVLVDKAHAEINKFDDSLAGGDEDSIRRQVLELLRDEELLNIFRS